MPRKCKRHAGPGKPPKDCVDCQEAARLAGPAPVRKPRQTIRLAAGPKQKSKRSTTPAKLLPAKAVHSSNGQEKKEPKVLTPAILRQRQRTAAQRVLREIRLMGGMHRCYDCPHAEEDHVLGECVLCWDERTRYHPFVSFLAGANRFFADVLSAPIPTGLEVALDYSYEAAVG